MESVLVVRDHRPGPPQGRVPRYNRLSGAPSGKEISFTCNGAPGTTSQHFGRELPDYLYFNTYVQGSEPQFVGAISRVRTALGFRITSTYVSLTPHVGNGKKVLSLIPHWKGNATPNAPVVVKSRFGDIEISLNDPGFEHDIDHATGTTWFNATVTCRPAGILKRPAVFELRGWLQLEAH